jgi:hypothetical protein
MTRWSLICRASTSPGRSQASLSSARRGSLAATEPTLDGLCSEYAAVVLGACLVTLTMIVCIIGGQPWGARPAAGRDEAHGLFTAPWLRTLPAVVD